MSKMSSLPLCLLLLVAANAYAASLQNKLPSRIIGGENAFIETYPHQVSLEYNGVHFCGGSILNKNMIITAALCATSYDLNYVTVRAGSTFAMSGGSVHRVNGVKIHERYEITEDNIPIYDVALLSVDDPFVFDDTRQPVQLYKKDEASKVGSWAVVTGYGKTDKDEYRGQLQSVALPIIGKEQCSEAYKVYANVALPEGNICAGYYGVGGKDACSGDSGSPMTINGRLAGIVSWGNGCGHPYYPGVYTEVAYFQDWIAPYA